MSHLQDRRGYYASGDVNWVRFLPAAAVSLLAAAGMAVALCAAFRYDLYYRFVVPLFAGMVVAGPVYVAICFGRCRSRTVALSLGVLAGAVMFLGHYYVDFVVEVGTENALCVDLVPDYLVWRTENTLTQSGTQKAHNYGSAHNWLMLLIDLGFAVSIVAHFAYRGASRSYCEHCGRWQKQVKFKAVPGVAAIIAETLEQGSVGTLQDMTPYLPHAPDQGAPYDEIALEYCPLDNAARGACPAYLTLDEHRASQLRTHLNKTSLVKQQELTLAELTGLAARVLPLEPYARALNLTTATPGVANSLPLMDEPVHA